MHWDSVFSCPVSDQKSMSGLLSGEQQCEIGHRFMQPA